MSKTLPGLAAVFLAIAILYGLQRTTPYYGEITSPIPIAGMVGERIEGDAFALGIVNVHLARTIIAESFGRTRTFTTSGLWAIVEGAAEAKQESLTLTSAEWLGPDGARYALSQRLSTTPGMLPLQRLEPGLPKPVLMAFEIPRDQVHGGTLLISRAAYTPLDEQARIKIAGSDLEDIRTTITIDRSGGLVPWTLKAE